MILAAALFAVSGYAEEAEKAEEREADVTVIAERIPPSEMSFDDMEFVTLAVDCGKRLFADGQEAAAWPYLKMGARYGDVDSQFWAASMVGRGEHVPQNWTEAVGWLGVAADGHLKPDATKMLRETKKSLCGGREECAEQFEAVVAEYVGRFGRESGGMACRRAKGQRGVGVSSLRINRGSRRVDCVFGCSGPGAFWTTSTSRRRSVQGCRSRTPPREGRRGPTSQAPTPVSASSKCKCQAARPHGARTSAARTSAPVRGTVPNGGRPRCGGHRAATSNRSAKRSMSRILLHVSTRKQCGA